MAVEISIGVLILVGCFQCAELKYTSLGQETNYNGAQAYHRSWTSWSIWSHCSRTCGRGIIMRTRMCRGRKGESRTEHRFCPGETVEYRICNTQNCPVDSVDFHEFQCSRYNNRVVAQQFVNEWIPYKKGQNSCELRCQTKEKGRHYSFGKVIDGTRCSDNAEDVCVNGRCSPVGCDGKVGSEAQLDVCGVCKGRNKTCIYYRNVYLGQPTRSGYHEVAVIPAGATNVEIRDVSHINALALMDHQRRYIINGPGVYSYAAQYNALGTYVTYEHLLENTEIIRIRGPTDHDCYIMAQLRGTHRGIYYEYWLSKDRTNGSLLEEDHRKKVEVGTSNPRPAADWKDVSSYHRYDVHDPPTKKWEDEGIRIVDTSGENVAIGVGYTPTPTPTPIPTPISAAGNNGSGVSEGCDTCVRVKNLTRNFCQSDFVLRTMLTEVKKVKKKIRYELLVIRSYKNKFPLHSKEYLWTPNECRCPKLRRNREYILMGRVGGEGRESHLLIDRHSFVRRYTKKRAQLLMKLRKKNLTSFCGKGAK